MSTKQPRILILDIESTSLTADSGICLCVGYKWLGEKTVYCPTIKTFPYDKDPFFADRNLMPEIAKVIEQADIWITYNGIRFDAPFINTRLLLAGGKPLPPIPHIDLYYTVKHKLRLHSNRLYNVERVLDLNENKTPIDFQHWVRAAGNFGKLSDISMGYIVDHCKQYVKVLEEAYLMLRPLMNRHPRTAPLGQCTRCSGKLQRRGFFTVKTPLVHKKQRLQCVDCGGWESIALTKVERLMIE